MPLAHIISPLSESSVVLAQDLRSRGYDVQTLGPSENSGGPADLEITVTECGLERAMRLAATVPIRPDMSVFVDPRVLNAGVRSIQLFILSDQAEEQRAQFGFQQVLAQALPPLVAAPVEVPTVAVKPETEVSAPVDQDEEILGDVRMQDLVPPAAQAGAAPEQEALRTTASEQGQDLRQEVKDDEFFLPLVLAATAPPAEASAAPMRLRIPPAGRRTLILGGTAAVLALALLAWGWSRPSAAQADGISPSSQSSVTLQNTPVQTIVVPFPPATSSQAVPLAKKRKPAPGVSLAAERVREKTVTPRRTRVPESDYVAPDTVVHVNGNTKAPAKKR